MKQIVKQHFNPYFFIPFFAWCIIGAFLLYCFDSTQLFVFINTHHYPFSDTLLEKVNYLGEGWVIVIIGLLALFIKPFRNLWFVLTTILCTSIPALISQWIKYQVAAPRPISVYGKAHWMHHLDHWAILHNNSFPSGHTTGAFSLMCLLASLINPKYRPLGFVYFLLAIMVAYARVYLAAHFFLDVYVGSIIGTIVSFLVCVCVYYFKNHKQNKQINQL